MGCQKDPIMESSPYPISPSTRPEGVPDGVPDGVPNGVPNGVRPLHARARVYRYFYIHPMGVPKWGFGVSSLHPDPLDLRKGPNRGPIWGPFGHPPSHYVSLMIPLQMAILPRMVGEGVM